MKDILHTLIKKAIGILQKEKIWPKIEPPNFEVFYPAQKEHGDITTNIALKLSKVVKTAPMKAGEQLVRAMYQIPQTKQLTEKVEVLQPGFINFHLHPNIVFEQLREILKKGKNFGNNNLGKNKKILVEFISANPTGPLTLANGRGGFTGDTLSAVLGMSGYKVRKEYYVNDIGNQVNLLAESVVRKKLMQKGVSVAYPEHLYQGSYIEDLGKNVKITINKEALAQKDALEKFSSQMQDEVLEKMIADIQRVVKDVMKIHFHQWFYESSLYKKLNLEKFVNELKKSNRAYEKDGALWFRTQKYGDDKDRVIVKADGEQTYFLSDILYLIKRFDEQKYNHKIYILGADHHGYVKRVKAMAAALGHEGKVDVLIMQLVKLFKKGKEVRMSKRAGNFVTIEEVIEEVDCDVARFFFLMYSADTHMDFDLDKALEKSEKNPVYYVQYAHARIASIEREMEKRNLKMKKENISPFKHAAEADLVKMLSRFPEVIEQIARSYEVHLLPLYALDIAKSFHNFYTHCRVIEDGKLNTTRAYIVKATKQVLARVLGLMGISAPEKMI